MKEHRNEGRIKGENCMCGDKLALMTIKRLKSNKNQIQPLKLDTILNQNKQTNTYTRYFKDTGLCTRYKFIR